MAGLEINGAIVIGPDATAAITTIPAYLASISKNSFYARWVAGTNMYVNADKTGGAVSLNGTVGSWEAEAANTSNFTAYWSQSSAVDRPYYATSNSINSLVGTGNDAGDTRHMQLTSTTALNGAYTLIIKVPLLARDTRTFYSHNSTAFSLLTSNGGGGLITYNASGTAIIDQIIHAVRSTPGTSSAKVVVGVSQTGTGHNNTAPYLLRRGTGYSISSISELWVMPQLTADELGRAIALVA